MRDYNNRAKQLINKKAQNKELEKVKKKVKGLELSYPIFAIGTKIYQEYKPGVLAQVSRENLRIKYKIDVTDRIQCLFGFTSEPSHLDYKGIVDDKYNLYKKITHIPKEGDWPNIKALMIHIFGKSYQMGMEYIWNLYVKPKQALPFLGLISLAKETGKSTFLNFIRAMFQENAVPLNGFDFSKEFNGHYINSLVGLSDEHAEGKERIRIAQKVKSLITEKDQRAERKGVEGYATKSYLKMILASNDEDMSTYIEEENTRYWILSIPEIDDKKVNFESLVEKEIPALLYYLEHVFKARPSRGRLYFAPKEFQTNAGQRIQQSSKPKLQKAIEAELRDRFEQNDSINEILLAPKHFASFLNLSAKEVDLDWLKQVLQLKMKKTKHPKSIRFTPGTGSETDELPIKKVTGRPYIFKRYEFFDLY